MPVQQFKLPDLGEGLTRRVDAEHACGNAALQLRRELRLEALRLERGIADRFASERIEVRGEMAVHP